MSIPVTPAEFLAKIPQTTQDPCVALSNALLAYPQLVYELMKWWIESDGSKFTQAFMNEIHPVGSYMYSVASNLDTGTASSRWLLCNGDQKSATDFPTLGALLVTGATSIFGVAAVGNFKLPDLRGKFPLGVSASHALGTSGGTETHVLTYAEMPEHHHFTDVPYSDATAGGTQTLAVNGTVASVTLQSTDEGGGAAHNNMPPYVAAGYWYIKT